MTNPEIQHILMPFKHAVVLGGRVKFKWRALKDKILGKMTPPTTKASPNWDFLHFPPHFHGAGGSVSNETGVAGMLWSLCGSLVMTMNPSVTQASPSEGWRWEALCPYGVLAWQWQWGSCVMTWMTHPVPYPIQSSTAPPSAMPPQWDRVLCWGISSVSEL